MDARLARSKDNIQLVIARIGRVKKLCGIESFSCVKSTVCGTRLLKFLRQNDLITESIVGFNFSGVWERIGIFD